MLFVHGPLGLRMVSPFEQSWQLLKMAMVDGSLDMHSTWQDDEVFDNVRYTAEFQNPETGKIHPMVADINHAQTSNKIPYPAMNVKILPPNYDVNSVPIDSATEVGELDGYEHSIAEADFEPSRSDDNHFNRNLVGKPRVKGAGPIQRLQGFGDWKRDNPQHSDISLADYLLMLANYKHQGHGTAMYNMAADILDRETRNSHVIVRDDTQSDHAERMWAKHEGKESWPSERFR